MEDLRETLRRGWLSLLTRPIEGAVHPEDEPSVHASGPDAYRLLLLGGGTAVGLGVSRHDRALPGHLARHLAAITGRGVDLDLTVRLGMTVADARAEIDGRELTGYDGVVLTLGTADALAALPADLWRDRLELLLTALRSRTTSDARIVAVGAHESAWSPYLHPRVTRLAASRLIELNRVSRELCWSLPRTSYVAPVERRTTATTQYSVLDYERLGRAAAAHLAHRLDRPRATPGAPVAPGSAPNGFTLASLGLLDLSADEVIDRVAARARSAFGVDGAKVCMMTDGAVQATSGTRRERAPASLTAAAAHPGGLALKDLRADARFRDSRLARRYGMAFYAGHPVFDRTGHAIAVLAIFDARPRTFSAQEMSLLRDHALLIQHVLAEHGSAPARHAPPQGGADAWSGAAATAG